MKSRQAVFETELPFSPLILSLSACFDQQDTCETGFLEKAMFEGGVVTVPISETRFLVQRESSCFGTSVKLASWSHRLPPGFCRRDTHHT
jgi:hypothetical protein